MATRAPSEPLRRSAEPSRPSYHRVQTALQVSQPGDAAEREAVATARKVMTMRRPTVAAHPLAIARVPAIAVPHPAAPIPASAPAAPVSQVPPAVESAIRTASGGGAPLAEDVRRFAEPRFRADFTGVRVHTDARAAGLATRVGARAFTYGRDIFFNAGQYRPETPDGMELIAHELTHVVQQREAVQREVDVTVRETAPLQVQRSPLDDAVAWIADHANAIPGFRLLTLVLGVNPVSGRAVERSAANVLRAAVEFLPGGALITEALDRYGIFDRVGGWIEQQLRSLGMVGSAFQAALMDFLRSLGVMDIFSPGSVWSRAQRIFTEPVARLLGFARGLAGQVLGFIREAILRPLGALAANTRGYDLLRAVLGFDPVTGEAVPRSPELLIGGFMRLIGQEEVWQNIQRSGAIPRAWAWFQGALSGLMGLVSSIPGRFMALLQGLTITDLVVVTRALARVASAFASFVGDFIGWGTGTVINLLQIIVEVVAPGVMPYIRRAAGAFGTILRNPIGFVRTLVSAAQLGFRQFASNFLTHLRTSLIGWLTGAMAGASIYVPQGFTLREILRFALSVMGLTWANIRGKLVRATNETVVRALETGFDIVRTLVTEGPAAAWQQIVQSLTNLREMVIEQVMTFVRDRIVTAAVTRLVSLLTPAGAFIQAIIATYNTVMFFVERLRQIAAVAASFIDSLATIAAGTIAPAANRVERTMAGLLTLVISFLARIAGLGRVADAVTNVINRIRAPIDRALDRVVAWIVAQARRLGRFVAQAGVPHDPQERLRLAVAAATRAVDALSGASVTVALMSPVLAAIRVRYGLTALVPVEQDGVWWVEASINPRTRGRTRKLARETGISTAQLGALLEPILARVEAAWMAERESEESRAPRAAYAESRALVGSGGEGTRGRVTLPPLSREQEIRLLREVAAGTVPITPASDRSPQMYAAVHVSGGTETVGGMYINEPANMGRNFIGSAGTYEGSIPTHVATVRASMGNSATAEADTLRELSPTRRRLTGVLEPARAPGMLVARRLGEELVEGHQATAAEVTHGRLAPMAFEGAAGVDMNSARNRGMRQRRVGAVIQRLRDAAASATILVEPGGPALRRLGDAVENWLRANARSAVAESDPRRMVSATQRLTAAFLAFLRSQQRGR